MSTYNAFLALESAANLDSTKKKKRNKKKKKSNNNANNQTRDVAAPLNKEQAIAELLQAGYERFFVDQAMEEMEQQRLNQNDVAAVKEYIKTMVPRKLNQTKPKAPKKPAAADQTLVKPVQPKPASQPPTTTQTARASPQPPKTFAPTTASTTTTVKGSSGAAPASAPPSSQPQSFTEALEKAASLPNFVSVLDGLILFFDDQRSRPADIFICNAMNNLFSNLFKACPTDHTVDTRLHNFLLKLLGTLSSQVRCAEGNMNTGIAAGALRRMMDALLALKSVQGNTNSVPGVHADVLTSERAAYMVSEALKEMYRANIDNVHSQSEVTKVESRISTLEAYILESYPDGMTPQLNLSGSLSPGDVSRLFKLRDSANEIIDLSVKVQQMNRQSGGRPALRQNEHGVQKLVENYLASTQKAAATIRSKKETMKSQVDNIEQELPNLASSVASAEQELLAKKNALESRRTMLMQELQQVDAQLRQVNVQLHEMSISANKTSQGIESKRTLFKNEFNKLNTLDTVYQTQYSALDSLREFIQATHAAVSGPNQGPAEFAANASSQWRKSFIMSGTRYLGAETACVNLIRDRIATAKSQIDTKMNRLGDVRKMGMAYLIKEVETQIETHKKELKEDEHTLAVLTNRAMQVSTKLAEAAGQLDAREIAETTPVLSKALEKMDVLGLAEPASAVRNLLGNVSSAPPGLVAEPAQRKVLGPPPGLSVPKTAPVAATPSPQKPAATAAPVQSPPKAPLPVPKPAKSAWGGWGAKAATETTKPAKTLKEIQEEQEAIVRRKAEEKLAREEAAKKQAGQPVQKEEVAVEEEKPETEKEVETPVAVVEEQVPEVEEVPVAVEEEEAPATVEEEEATTAEKEAPEEEETPIAVEEEEAPVAVEEEEAPQVEETPIAVEEEEAPTAVEEAPAAVEEEEAPQVEETTIAVEEEEAPEAEEAPITGEQQEEAPAASDEDETPAVEQPSEADPETPGDAIEEDETETAQPEADNDQGPTADSGKDDANDDDAIVTLENAIEEESPKEELAAPADADEEDSQEDDDKKVEEQEVEDAAETKAEADENVREEQVSSVPVEELSSGDDEEANTGSPVEEKGREIVKDDEETAEE